MLPVGKPIQPGKPIKMGSLPMGTLSTKADRKGLMNGKGKTLVTGKKQLLTKKDKDFSIL